MKKFRFLKRDAKISISLFTILSLIVLLFVSFELTYLFLICLGILMIGDFVLYKAYRKKGYSDYNYRISIFSFSDVLTFDKNKPASDYWEIALVRPIVYTILLVIFYLLYSYDYDYNMYIDFALKITLILSICNILPLIHGDGYYAMLSFLDGKKNATVITNITSLIISVTFLTLSCFYGNWFGITSLAIVTVYASCVLLISCVENRDPFQRF